MISSLFVQVRFDPLAFQKLEDRRGHVVVDDALVHNGTLLDAVECGGIVLEMLNHQIRIIRCINDLGLSFV